MWEIGYMETNHGFMKIIQRGSETIAVVENLSNEFVHNIINCHNNAVDKSYARGLKDGVKLAREGK